MMISDFLFDLLCYTRCRQCFSLLNHLMSRSTCLPLFDNVNTWCLCICINMKSCFCFGLSKYRKFHFKHLWIVGQKCRFMTLLLLKKTNALGFWNGLKWSRFKNLGGGFGLRECLPSRQCRFECIGLGGQFEMILRLVFGKCYKNKIYGDKDYLEKLLFEYPRKAP